MTRPLAGIGQLYAREPEPRNFPIRGSRPPDKSGVLARYSHKLANRVAGAAEQKLVALEG